MKLTEKEMESVKCTLIDETSDFILDRVCTLMYEASVVEGASYHDLDLEQIDEIVCSVFKGLYYEEKKIEQ